jgi:NEDD8-activating enzyme E1 regulatory subunit
MLQTGTSLLSAMDDDSVPPSVEVCDAMLAILADMVEDETERPDQSPLLWYLGYEACQRFFLVHDRYPGTPPPTPMASSSEDDMDAIAVDSDDFDYLQDVEALQACLMSTVQKYKLQDHPIILSNVLAPSMDLATEYVRYGQAEIHTIASIVGGVASQEAVKLITGQYVPMNNTYFYNGIASTAGVYKL